MRRLSRSTAAATTAARKLGYLEATVDFGLKHPEVGDDFAAFLRERLAQRRR